MNHRLINDQSIAGTGQSPHLCPRRGALHAFLSMTAIVVFAGCAGHGNSGGSYRSGGYYGSPGYSSGSFYGGHRGPSFGIQHGFGRSGFGHGGFGGSGGFSPGGIRH